jgi:hypothetical protein
MIRYPDLEEEREKDKKEGERKGGGKKRRFGRLKLAFFESNSEN